MSIFDTFERKHDFLVCVDSDGCVMDTMNCKHFHCFGPCMVTEWGLEAWKDTILERWNVINLFSNKYITRYTFKPELENLLKYMGFEVLKTYGDFKGTEFGKTPYAGDIIMFSKVKER